MSDINGRRALPGETEVQGFYVFPTSLNILPPPPVWVASTVIGQVASRRFKAVDSRLGQLSGNLQ